MSGRFSLQRGISVASGMKGYQSPELRNGSDESSTMDEDDFNQGIILPPLIIQLRKILDQYPDDTQILKELIQNAEDAGAKEVKFLCDRHSYGQDPRYLHHPDLAEYQGPALYAYNDALFTEDDWKGIRMLSQSVKQDDPFKVGYFGLGFKSVFHITDLPSMLSGDKMGIIDPHQQILPASSHGWNISKRPDLLSSLPHQLEPFIGLFGCDAGSFRTGFYNGTLFRFPLRNKATPLSSVLYGTDKVKCLMETFQQDAHLLLIFLKNLERITLYERDSKVNTPRLVFKVELGSDCLEEVRAKRTDFMKQVKAARGQERTVITTYPITINTESYSDRSLVPIRKSYRFLVTNYYLGSNPSPVFRNLFRDPELGYLPWVGTAMRIDVRDALMNPEVYDLTDQDGRLFCFLPLPVEEHISTGLPVHIHGFFSLEQNRKYIKWPTSNRLPDQHMDKGLVWNQCMLKEALPKAYSHMVREAIRIHASGSGAVNVPSVYRALPDLTKIERRWESIISLVYTELLTGPLIFYTSPSLVEWIDFKSALFNTLDRTDEATQVIIQILESSTVKIVHVPEHVLGAVRKYCHFQISQITANIVAAAFKDVQYRLTLQWDSKMALLRYFLRQSKLELLDDLELLPLANGGFEMFHFNPKKADRSIYVLPSDDMQSLLPGLKDDFLDNDLDPEIKQLLIKASQRGYTQLKVLDAALVGSLLPRCLPQTWISANPSNTVVWNPRELGHPPEAWLESLWLFMGRCSPRDLGPIEGLPVLPVRTYQRPGGPGSRDQQTVVELLPLSKASVAIVRTQDGLSLGTEVEEIISALGVTVVDELPDYVKSHPLVSKLYIFSPTYLGVLKAIERKCSSDGREVILGRFEAHTTTDQKRSLRGLLAKISVYEIQRESQELLARLPLLETAPGSGGSGGSRFVAVVGVSLAAPPEPLPFPVSKPLLDVTSSDSAALAKLLNVKQLNMAQLLIQVVYPDIEAAYYEHGTVQKIMRYSLKHYQIFTEADKSFRKALRYLAFMPKGDMLLTPDRFYDPDHSLLQKLFLFESNFPPPDYSDPATVMVLKEVGLRGLEDVEPEDLQEAALSIQTISSTSLDADKLEKLSEKSDALLEYLHRHKSKLKARCSGSTLAEVLKDISWVRVEPTRQSPYPPNVAWYGSSSGRQFYKPCDLILKNNALLGGSVRPVVGANVYNEVAQAFNWHAAPGLDVILDHLVNVLSAANVDPASAVKNKAAFLETSRAMYTELSRYDPKELQQAFARHSVPAEWIWTGEGYHHPEKIVIEPPFMDLRPYVTTLPPELMQYRAMFENFGIMEKCFLPDVLYAIKVKYDTVNSSRLSGQGRPDDADVKRDLNICVCVLNEVKLKVKNDDWLDIRSQLYLPVHPPPGVQTLKLAPIAQCAYTDDESIRQGHSGGGSSASSLDVPVSRGGSTASTPSILPDDSPLTLVHANVPSSTLEAIGVPTLLSRMLEAEELDYSFGHTDSLISRLNLLMQDYTDGFAIPKELIQNADDAGATEVKLLYDERSNLDSMTGLIDEGMRDCHGAALWVFNNALFSDEDFENITKLNGATKETQTDKIGRFGLGFNVVYNITDVPSFVSRHNIVIFDPHTTYLGRSIRNKAKPGLKLDMRRHRKKLRSLTNQFKPYNDVFNCDLRKQESYPGTLFRLPLRTRLQAARSEICGRHYEDKEVRELFRMIVEGAENLLLFTQNVLRFSLYHLPNKASSPLEMVEIFHAAKKPIRILRELNPSVLKLSDPVKHLDDEMQRFIKQCSLLRSSTEVMRQIRKGANPDRINFPDSSMLLNIDSELTIKGEALVRLAREHRVQTWLVCSCMGRGDSLKMALLEHYLSPTAGVAVPLERVTGANTYRPRSITNPVDPSSPHGSIFAFLPLPTRSGLPVHINGSFAVTANRRQLVEGNDDDKYNSAPRWNASLLSDAVCSAYIRLLGDVATFLATRNYDFSTLWPNADHTISVCNPLLVAFYKEISGKTGHSLTLFSDGLRWATIDNTIFLDCAYKEPALVAASLEVCRQSVVANASKVAVILPAWIKRGFIVADNENALKARTYDEVEFFEKMLLPNIDVITQDDRDLLILHSLSKNSAALNRFIRENHCIPVTPDGTRLRQSTELVDPQSYLAKLFTPSDARFPYGVKTYGREDILQVLRGIGMKQNARDLSWDEFIERVQIVGGTTDRKTAQELSAIILSILGDKLADSSSAGNLRNVQQQLMDLRFIPCMAKPRRFPLTWKGSENTKDILFKPVELYPPECKDLIGCVHYIADPNVFPKDSDDIYNFLRLGMEWKEPTLTQILEQLDVLSNPDTENYLHERELQEEIQKMCYNMCHFLQQKCANKTQHQAIREALGNRYFLLANNRFLSPKQVAMNFTQNCAPHLFAVPDHYKRNYPDLLNVVGVRDHFEAKDFVYALQSMHDVYLSEPLDRESLKLAQRLVSLLNEAMSNVGQNTQEIVAKYGPIYKPDSRNILQSETDVGAATHQAAPAATAAAPPAGMVRSAVHLPAQQQAPAAAAASSVLAHGQPAAAPQSVQRQVSVSTSSSTAAQRMNATGAAPFSTTSAATVSSRPAAASPQMPGVPFGQKESLTNRIKRILAGYPCDKEILKELLQNADDAGATEIMFIKDPRQHATERILDQSWRPLQGPALCVYNNQPFTQADFEGIQKLGQGSKGSDPNKTGQYGVGFNCVYHLTDVPSFLTKSRETGDTLCMFDPHGRYVPGATVEEPGRRYDNVAQLRSSYPDIFPCYLEDKVGYSTGTMFRFPLRNDAMASTSELSDQVMNVQNIDKLFAKFKQEIFDCLLFINNVNKITLTEIDPRSNALVNTFTVSVEMSAEDSNTRKEFSDFIRNVSSRMQTSRMQVTDVPVREVTYIVTLTDNKNLWEKWMVSQRIGVDQGVKVPPTIQDAIRSGDLALLPRGGVACLIDSSDSECNRRPSKVFCFLPLPIKTDLPVHINGHFTLDHEARRNLWLDDDTGSKTEWNNMLLRNVIAPAYTMLLRRIPPHLSTSMVGQNISLMDSLADEVPNLDTYCKLFPQLNKQTRPGYWKTLTEAVYRRIHQKQELVLPVAKPLNDSTPSGSHLDSSSSMSEACHQVEVEWMSTGSDGVQRPYFDNIKESFRDATDESRSSRCTTPTRRRRSRSTIKKPSHEVLRHVLLACGFKLVKLPFDIYESFVEAGVSVGCITPRAVIDFFSSYSGKTSVCQIPRLPTEISGTPFKNDATLKVIHEYCCQDIPHFRGKLNGLPLLLCEDDLVRMFSTKEKVFLSSHHEILPRHRASFIHHVFVGSIFKDADIESCDVFKRFDIKAFSTLLSSVLPQEYQAKPTSSAYIKWNVENFDQLPNDSWIFNVWNFLHEEFERTMELQQTVTQNENAQARAFLQPLRDWYLVPAKVMKPSKASTSRSSSRSSVSVEETGEHFLVPIRLAETVIDYSMASIMSNPVRVSLSKLGVPELDSSLLDGALVKKSGSTSSAASNQSASSAGFVKLIVATPEQPRSVMKALQHAMLTNQTGAQCSMEDCYVILKYFSDSLSEWDDDKDVREILRSLPVHITIQNSIVSIDKTRAYILQDDLPDSEMSSWQTSAGVLLLRPNAQFQALYETLGCTSLTSTQAYSAHLFNNFEKFSADARVNHLTFLKDYKLPQLKQQERAVFLRQLALLEFIPQADGRLGAPDKFFDPEQPVFKVMLSGRPSAFPPKPFDEYNWLEFLRLVGLQKELNIELVVRFANEIANRAKHSPNEETFNQARTLVTHLFKMKPSMLPLVLKEIRNVPFIPAARVSGTMRRIYPARGDSDDSVRTAYIKFQDGTPEEHASLVWSSSYLLPTWANPFHLTEHDVTKEGGESLREIQDILAKGLGIHEHPSVDLVIEHIQNICTVHYGKSDENQEMRLYVKMDLMNKIYKFLQERLNEPGQHDQWLKSLHRLAETPCIFTDAGQMFVKPKQVVINLYEEDQIYPYLFQAPTELGEYKKLFMYLGATLHATADQYAAVLENIHQQTGGEKLHPNEMRLAFKAVYGMFTTLQKRKHLDAMAHVHTLYLPTKGGYLHKSTDIVSNDDQNIAERIKSLGRPFLVDLSECKIISNNYEDVVKLLPKRLRPMMLSSIVLEVMDEKSRENLVLHTVADKLKYQLTSKSFFQGLIRLVKHEHRKSGHRIRQTAVESIEQHLKKIHVYGTDKLITYLEYENKKIPGSESEMQCYVDRKFDDDSGMETWNICINKTTCLSEELQVAVAEAINKLIGGLLKNSVHYIQPILSCVPHSIMKILDRLRIRPDQQYPQDQPTLPSSGSLIPIEDHHLLKDDFEQFETGEYVGYEIDDDASGGQTFVYAIIIEKMVDESFESPSSRTSDSDHTELTHNRLTQKYRINVGEERPPTIAVATDLYKFRRVDGYGRKSSTSSERRPSWSGSPMGTGGPMSPGGQKSNYRDSFYDRSSMFEPDEWNADRDSMKRQDSAVDDESFEEVISEGELPTPTPRSPKTFQFDDIDSRQMGEDVPMSSDLVISEEAGEHPSRRYGGDQQQQPRKPAMSREEEQKQEEMDEVKKTMEEVSDTLEEAWRMPEAQRKKIIKRLMLKWHPDKNIGQEAFATVITQHIQAELERLELGLPRPMNFDPAQFDFDPRNPFSGTSSFQQNFANAYKFFFEQMNQRAKEHREQRERYQDGFRGEFDDGVPSFGGPNPQPAQARRFLRQAQEDLKAADNDYDAPDPAYEWTCFKAHQAAEKALKAAQFSVDAVTSFSHDLAILAASLEDVELRRLAQKLQKIVGNSNKLYNPDPIDFVVIPHEEYTKEVACDAVMCAVDILERVKEFVELRETS